MARPDLTPTTGMGDTTSSGLADDTAIGNRQSVSDSWLLLSHEEAAGALRSSSPSFGGTCGTVSCANDSGSTLIATVAPESGITSAVNFPRAARAKRRENFVGA